MIETTTVGSYPIPDWLRALPSGLALMDATRVVIDTQRQAGIDLPTDGELYRFDVNDPDTNGMIEYFTRPLDGIRNEIGLKDATEFSRKPGMEFRSRPAGVVEGPITEGSLDLKSACERASAIAGENLKFTVTSPYMLARTLLDRHYGDFEEMLMAIADVLADQIETLSCRCVQVDEANITGHPEGGPLASRAINRLLDKVRGEKAVHFCFGNYGGQTIQDGQWGRLIEFLNSLRCDHLVLEVAHRPPEDLQALKDVRPEIGIGVGVIDIKVNHVETPDEVARRIEEATTVLGTDRVRWVHPDCGMWMLGRSVADRKIAALVEGRNLFEGR